MNELGIVLKKIESLEKRMDERFDDVEAGFVSLDEKIDSVEERMDRKLEGRFEKLSNTVEDMRENLEALVEASAKDTLGLMNHEYRIAHIERIHDIPPVTPAHLADLED